MKLTENQIFKIRLAGIWVTALFILVDSYHDLWEIFHYDWYRVMQADMPDWLVCVRYVVSVTLRILMLWAVAGVLIRREPYRKMLVALSYFNLAMIVFHHRYVSFVYISNFLGLNTEDFLQTVRVFGRDYYPGAVVRMLEAWINELFPAFLGIAIFSHPKIKRLFQ